jgi:hypothetical protein
MKHLDISASTMWKPVGEYEWIIVDKVHGMKINGRLRTVPGLETDWIGSPASFENLQLAPWRTVNATCSEWDLQTCIRVLAEHWITYESIFGVNDVGAPLQFVVVSMRLFAISDEEAVKLVEGALSVAGAEWIQCRIRASVGWGSAS